MDLHKIPKWTGAFCSLFFINVMSSGSMKVCGVYFESMKEMEGLSGSMTGLIFVTPNAVSHLIAPLITSLTGHLSYRQLGTFGGILTGGSFICSGLFSSNGYHFVGFSVIAGVGFGLLFYPAVLCLRDQTPNNFTSLMPLATLGSYCGIVLLPGVVNVFHQTYGLHAAFCLFGAMCLNTIPCGLVLVGGKNNQSPETVTESDDKIESDNTETLNQTNKKRDMCCNVKWGQHFPRVFLDQFALFLDPTFTIFFITANTRRFPADTWTLFLIPYNQEHGLSISDAVLISSFGGIGGIIGRMTAAALFRATHIISPLTLFAIYYCLNGIVFASFSLWNNFIFLIICGFSSGVLLSVLGSSVAGIVVELSTPEKFGRTLGVVQLGCGVSSILAGFLSGMSYDVFGSFEVMFHIDSLISAVSCVLVILIIFLRKAKNDI